MITVCIATYNGAEYIEEQIDSILPQLTDNDQIVICDDCSTDLTVDVIRSIDDSRIELFCNEENLGYTRNFEKALTLAKGEYIFLCDQDDIWKPNKVSVCLNYLESYDCVISNAELCDAKGVSLNQSFFVFRSPKRTKIGNLIKFGYLGCCMAFRKNIIAKALPFPQNTELATHDNWLCLVAMWFGNTIITDDMLICYRRHNHNVSSGGATSTTKFIFKIKYRLYLILNLIKRATF